MSEPVVGSPHSPFLTADEAFRYLRFASRRAFYKAIERERIPHRRRGGRTLLFLKSELDRWLADNGAGERQPTGPALVKHARAR